MDGKAVMLERVSCGVRPVSEDDEAAKAGISRRSYR